MPQNPYETTLVVRVPRAMRRGVDQLAARVGLTSSDIVRAALSPLENPDLHPDLTRTLGLNLRSMLPRKGRTP